MFNFLYLIAKFLLQLCTIFELTDFLLPKCCHEYLFHPDFSRYPDYKRGKSPFYKAPRSPPIFSLEWRVSFHFHQKKVLLIYCNVFLHNIPIYQVYFLKQKPFGYYHNNFYYLKFYYRLLYMQNTDLSDHLLVLQRTS